MLAGLPGWRWRRCCAGSGSSCSSRCCRRPSRRASASSRSISIYRVFLFACVVAGAVTILFALLPALQATRLALTDALRGQLTGAIRGGTLRSLLVTGQVTVSLVLLIVAATILKNGAAIRATDLGMRDRGRDLGARERGNKALFRNSYEALADAAGVGSVAVASRSPLFGEAPRVPLRQPSGMHFPSYAFVSPNYFDLLGISIVRGRGFSEPGSGGRGAGDHRQRGGGAAVVDERRSSREDGPRLHRTAGPPRGWRHDQGDASVRAIGRCGGADDGRRRRIRHRQRLRLPGRGHRASLPAHERQRLAGERAAGARARLSRCRSTPSERRCSASARTRWPSTSCRSTRWWSCSCSRCGRRHTSVLF